MGNQAPNLDRVGCKGIMVTAVNVRGADMLFIDGFGTKCLT